MNPFILRLILEICSLANLILGYFWLVTSTPDKAIFYVLISLWLLIMSFKYHEKE